VHCGVVMVKGSVAKVAMLLADDDQGKSGHAGVITCGAANTAPSGCCNAASCCVVKVAKVAMLLVDDGQGGSWQLQYVRCA
jgi:hypothetical protein